MSTNGYTDEFGNNLTLKAESPISLESANLQNNTNSSGLFEGSSTLHDKTLVSLSTRLSQLDSQTLVSLIVELFHLDENNGSEVDANSSPAASRTSVLYALTPTATALLARPPKSQFWLDLDRKTLEWFRETVKTSYYDTGVEGMLKTLKDAFNIIPINVGDV